MNNPISKQIRLFGRLFSTIFIVCLLTSNNLFAISRLGPDPAEFNLNGANAKYVVAKSANTGNQSSMHIPVYYTGATPPSSVNLSVYGMTRGAYSNNSEKQYLSVNGSDPFYTSGTQNISLSGLTWDSTVGLWSKDVTIVLRNGNNNNTSLSFLHNRMSFRLSLPTGGNWLLGNGGSGDYFNTLASNPSGGQNKGYNYAVQFATPCSIVSNTPGDIYLFDLDSGGADNEYRDITVSVRDVTSGDARQATTDNGRDGDAQTYKLSMTFEPSHKYLLKINNVSPINLVQYKIPYDGVNFVTGCSYNLQPSVTLNKSNGLVSEQFLVSKAVQNTKSGTAFNINWQLTEKIVSPGGTIISGGNSDNDPCTYFGADRCTAVDPHTGPNPDFIGNATTTLKPPYPNTVANLAVGTKICYILSVKPRANAPDNNWAHSDPACLTIGEAPVVKKPKVQIWGGDLMVGRAFAGTTATSNVATSVSANGTKTFGSWVEYAIFAKGVITNTASGSAYAGTGLAGSSTCNYSKLSFTNTGSGSTCSTSTSAIGGYTNSRNIPNVAASFPITSTAQALGPTVNLTGKSKLWTTSAPVTITGGEIGKGQWIVINAPNADVNITDDIKYYSGSDLHAISDIPQVVIIAKNINIAGSVNNIDAWLITKGSINTCSDVAINASLSTDICNKQLQVNGPVMAGKLYLRRTAGSATGSTEDGKPAEIFNLRADAYLWAYSQASKSNTAITVLSTELPPRY